MFSRLLERTVQVLQDFAGALVEGSLRRAKRALMRAAIGVAVAAVSTGVAVVFLSMALWRWLETVTKAPWTAPLLVGIAAGVVAIVATKLAGQTSGE
jgi:precorrin-3B methylase